MKSLKSLHVFLAAAAAAFLLPACGGGDNDNGDYYISPEQFKAGAKGYTLNTSPEATYRGGVNDIAYPMTSEQGKAMFGQLPETAAGAQVKEEGKSGWIMDGTITFSTSQSVNARIAYYVNGGATGTGYMYVSLTNDSQVQNCESELCHMMGCLSPADVKYAGLTSAMLPLAGSVNEDTGESESTELYLLPRIQRVLLVSMQGVSFVVQYHFTQGMCDIYLCYAKAYIPTDDDVGSGYDARTPGTEGRAQGEALFQKATEQATSRNVTTDAAVSISRPFHVTF